MTAADGLSTLVVVSCFNGETTIVAAIKSVLVHRGAVPKDVALGRWNWRSRASSASRAPAGPQAIGRA